MPDTLGEGSNRTSRGRHRTSRQLPDYLDIDTDKPVERFLRMVLAVRSKIDDLSFVTPYIGLLHDTKATLEQVVRKIDREKIKTTIITTEPRTAEMGTQTQALDRLSESKYTRIYFNQALHAKLYVCSAQGKGFALFGSGNMTQTSINQRIELGMLVRQEYREGTVIFNHLRKWALHDLRVLSGTKRIKALNHR